MTHGRQIVLDTETTGLDPTQGHRIVEIACIEIYDLMPTGKHYHVYVNPERDVAAEAYRVHGLSYEFLRNHPVFAAHADDFLQFIGDSPLVIHNAPFDLKFLKHHIAQVRPKHVWRNSVVDTLVMTRKKFPGSPATLDALCKRFNISLEKRTKHGALTDTQLLAEVYLDLCDGRRPSFLTAETPANVATSQTVQAASAPKQRKTPLPSRLKSSDVPAERTLPPQLAQLAAQVRDGGA